MSRITTSYLYRAYSITGPASARSDWPSPGFSGDSNTSTPLLGVTMALQRSSSISPARYSTSRKLNEPFSFSRNESVPASGSRSASRTRLQPSRFHCHARLAAMVLAPHPPFAGTTTYTLAFFDMIAGLSRAILAIAASSCSCVNGCARNSVAPWRRQRRIRLESSAESIATTGMPLLMACRSARHFTARSGSEVTSKKHRLAPCSARAS